MATVLDGKALAERGRAEIKEEVAALGQLGLATVLVGDDAASQIYIRRKHEAAREVGIEATVEVVATGRSDYPNQINNVLAFPGVFRGALDVRAREINEEMKVAAAHAIAGTIADTELSADYIVPSVFNRTVAPAVAAAVAQAADETGVARRRHAPASA